jgi:hypothetical protein
MIVLPLLAQIRVDSRIDFATLSNVSSFSTSAFIVSG